MESIGGLSIVTRKIIVFTKRAMDNNYLVDFSKPRGLSALTRYLCLCAEYRQVSQNKKNDAVKEPHQHQIKTR